MCFSLIGIVSIGSAHPYPMFAYLSTMVPAKRVPFYPLLHPIIGQSLVAAKDFSILEDMMETNYYDLWDDPASESLKEEYRRQWSAMGAKRVTCYLRDNFRLKGNPSKEESMQ